MEDQLSDLTRQPEQLTLPNGLRVRLLHLPHARQAAALVRVHAGAHDAPTAYPGLAHFLEHLLFLGSQRFPVTDSLMAYVQRCGGQLNASTRERHTDFYFQLSADLLEPGLERLLDMLAAPLLDSAAQSREREVLQAEYQARAQDSETLCDAALGTALGTAHPFAGFHAGNRETLPVEQPAFQTALRGYHQDFYHAAQMELLLAGPQPLAALEQLAMQADALLKSMPAQMQKPPALRSEPDSWLHLQLEHGEPRLDLAFCLDGLPPVAAAALDYLGAFISAETPQSLASRLREQGWLQSLRLRVPYWHEGQGVVFIEAMLTGQGVQQRAELVEAVLDWLRFFGQPGIWPAARDEYRRIRERSLLGLEPLARLRYWVEPHAWSAGQDEQSVRNAFDALMRHLLASPPVVLLADRQPCADLWSSGFPLRLERQAPLPVTVRDWQWQLLPGANPWLQRTRPAAQPAAQRRTTPALRWLGPLDPGGQGVLNLRWRFDGLRPAAVLWHALADALQAQQWAARQAGVEMRFEDLGSSWSLSLSGFAEVLPVIAIDLCRLFAAPPQASFTAGIRLAQTQDQLAGDEMLIRQLIRRLPRLLDAGTQVPAPAAGREQAALTASWQQARWDGLASGLAEQWTGPLADALDALATPSGRSQCSAAVAARSGRHWCDAGLRGAETGLLLFCPLPSMDAPTEAAWRLLARLIEGDFFRRLRSELQLGYAVFSRFSQFGAQAGILFAVQSPSASAAAIVEHVEMFLGDFADKLQGMEPARLHEEALALALQLETLGAEPRHRAERTWQAVLAGGSLQHPKQVVAALRDTAAAQAGRQLQALRDAQGGWRVFANAEAPVAERWQRTV